MKRGMIIGLIVGVLLTSGFVWVVSSRSLSDITLETAQSTVASNPTDTRPVSAAETAADKESLQSLITMSGQNAIKTAIRRVGPAVVQINVTRKTQPRGLLDSFFKDDPFLNFFSVLPKQRQQETYSLGSGVFIVYEGQIYVLTNNHVIGNADSLQVVTAQNLEFSAQVVGADAEMDVAILKLDDLEGQTVPTAELGDSDTVEIGDWAVAIGNPLGLSHTVTAGIISALGRDIPNPNPNAPSRLRSLIQTDAAINPGNSGGPLVNALGQVVGINTLITTNAEGLNFSININEIKRLLPHLIHNGKLTRAWLGVFIQPLTTALAEHLGVPDGQGVVVSDVVPGASAAEVLQSGDIITQVEGVPVRTVTELQDEITFREVGTKVTLTVIRDRQPTTLEMTLGEKLSGVQINANVQPSPMGAE